MPTNSDHVSMKASLIGLAFGATIALFFAATGNPGLIGVGVAIGVSVSAALNQHTGH